MSKNEHLNKDGLSKIISLRSSLNKGLSGKKKVYFPNIIKVKRPKVDLLKIDYNWIAGFFSGECCFFINISKSKDCKLGYTLMLQIIIDQHIRDKLLMNSLMATLGCGKISKRTNRDIITLRISKFQDIYSKIIPLFNQYEIRGIKLLDYKDFVLAAEFVNKKAHLTLKGLEYIRKIKSGMNKSRIHTFYSK